MSVLKYGPGIHNVDSSSCVETKAKDAGACVGLPMLRRGLRSSPRQAAAEGAQPQHAAQPVTLAVTPIRRYCRASIIVNIMLPES